MAICFAADANKLCMSITFRRQCWFVLRNASVKVNNHPPFYVLHRLSFPQLCVYGVCIGCVCTDVALAICLSQWV